MALWQAAPCAASATTPSSRLRLAAGVSDRHRRRTPGSLLWMCAALAGARHVWCFLLRFFSPEDLHIRILRNIIYCIHFDYCSNGLKPPSSFFLMGVFWRIQIQRVVFARDNRVWFVIKRTRLCWRHFRLNSVDFQFPPISLKDFGWCYGFLRSIPGFWFRNRGRMAPCLKGVTKHSWPSSFSSFAKKRRQHSNVQSLKTNVPIGWQCEFQTTSTMWQASKLF